MTSYSILPVDILLVIVPGPKKKTGDHDEFASATESELGEGPELVSSDDEGDIAGASNG